MNMIPYPPTRGRFRKLLAVQNVFVVPQRNPLLIDTVLSCLAGFLDYETLKISRMVCHQWKGIFDSAFMQRSTFSYTNYCRTIQLIPPGMILSFPEPVQSLFVSINPEFRLTAFEFELYMLRRFVIVGTSFDPNMLTYLKIVNCEPVYLKESSFILDYVIGPNLRTLELLEHSAYKECHPWIVSLEKLSTVYKIELENCVIDMITDDLKMSPIELKLSQCSRRLDGRITREMPLQEMVDFRQLKRLEIDGSCVFFCGDGPCEPIVKFSDCSQIKDLSLTHTSIKMDANISPQRLILQCNKYFMEVDGQTIKLL